MPISPLLCLKFVNCQHCWQKATNFRLFCSTVAWGRIARVLLVLPLLGMTPSHTCCIDEHGGPGTWLPAGDSKCSHHSLHLRQLSFACSWWGLRLLHCLGQHRLRCHLRPAQASPPLLHRCPPPLFFSVYLGAALVGGTLFEDGAASGAGHGCCIDVFVTWWIVRHHTLSRLPWAFFFRRHFHLFRAWPVGKTNVL